MTRVEKANSKAQAEVDDWNAKHEVGTVVRYWSLLKRGDPTGETPTIDPAYVTPGVMRSFRFDEKGVAEIASR